MTTANWRTINIDLYDPDSAANFPTASLLPSGSVASVSRSEIQAVAGQVRQLLRGGDAEGALRGALDMAPYGGDAATKELHLATVTEILQGIKASDISNLLSKMFREPGGAETLDVLMKYLYKGMAQVPSSKSSAGVSSDGLTPQATGFSQIQGRTPGEGGGQAMSVLLSWHEKLVEIVGPGSIVRVMSDRRTV